jgi:hypothetical protein
MNPTLKTVSEENDIYKFTYQILTLV